MHEPTLNPEWIEKPLPKTTLHGRVAYHAASQRLRVVWSNEGSGLPHLPKDSPAYVAWECYGVPAALFYSAPATERLQVWFYTRVYGRYRTERLSYSEYMTGVTLPANSRYLQYWTPEASAARQDELAKKIAKAKATKEKSE